MTLLVSVTAPAVADQPFMVKNINPFGTSQPWFPVALGDRIFFNADDGVHGQELWVSDGTEPGTHLVKDIVPGSDGFVPSWLVRAGNLIFFIGDDNQHGFEFWVTDGTKAGTRLVKDIDPSTEGNPFEQCGLYSTASASVGGTLFFRWDDGVTGRELWKTDGTESGTALVKDIIPGPGDGTIQLLIDAGGTLIFTTPGLPDNIPGFDLWRSDGTEAGTFRLKDLAWTLWPTYAGGLVFFQGEDDSPTGVELWASDGTETGTYLVKDINPGSLWSRPNALTAVGNTIFFSAFEPTFGRELWKSDGTEAGTVMVKDINPTGSSGIFEALGIGDTLFFSSSDGVNGDELWKSDGTEAGTVMVKDINPTGGSDIQYMVDAYGTLYFTADDGVNGRELWRSDGTEEGTEMVEVRPGPDAGLGFNNADLTVAGEFLFFKGQDNVNFPAGGGGVELWALDVVPPTNSGKIPTVSQWGLVVLALLTATAGSLVLRRTRRAY